ncbi:hypothetical protein [Caulobacter segnis]|uniref:hypothetical protein n=1 Tax=Caulobacter segnis TaxID=88688 RepID=UPI001FCA9B6F|nr:hypothetical protein [Caulobacter segnis]
MDGLAVGTAQEKLEPLVAAGVLGEQDLAVRQDVGRGHRLVIEGDLAAIRARRADHMQLIGVAEPRGDQHAAVRQPIAERGGSGVLVARQAFTDRRRRDRHILEDLIADFAALDGLREGRRGGGQGQDGDGGDEQLLHARPQTAERAPVSARP